MRLTITPELEYALNEQARQQGISPETLALASLRKTFLSSTSEDSGPTDSTESTTGNTLADFLGGFIGSIRSGDHIPGGAQMSENSGNKFAEIMIQKREQGRL